MYFKKKKNIFKIFRLDVFSYLYSFFFIAQYKSQ